LATGARTGGLLDFPERICASFYCIDDCFSINIFAEADNGFFHNERPF